MSILQVLAILWARRWVILVVTLGALASAAIVVRLLPERYEATAQMLLNVSDADIVTNLQMPSGLMRDAVHTHIETLRSPGDAMKAAQVLGWDKKPEYIEAFKQGTGGNGDILSWLGNILLSATSVYRVGASEIVAVKAVAKDPQTAADIANAFVTAHRLKDIEMRVDPAQQTLRWYEEQLATLQQNLAKAQANRIAQRRAADAKLAGQRVIGGDTDIAKDYANARLELTQAQVVLEQAKNQEATAANSPEVSQLQRRLRELDQQIGQDSATLGPQHRRVKQLIASRAALASEVSASSAQALSKATTGARERVMLAERKLAELTKAYDAALDQNDGRAGLNAADQEVDAIQTQIRALLDRREKTRLGTAVDNTPIAELSRAVPAGSPSFPKPALTLGLAGGMGLIFAMVLALLLEMFDRRIRNGRDVEAYVEAPLLITVPKTRFGARSLKNATVLPSRPWPMERLSGPGRA